MNHQQLLEAVQHVSGGTFIGIDTVTTPKLTGGKSNPMQGRVQKVMLGASTQVFTHQQTNAYQNAVKRRLESEGQDPAQFVLQPRKWGERLPNVPVVEHKGNLYLEVQFIKSGEVSYLLDGQPIAESDIEGLPVKREAAQGGLSDENKVILRDFKFDSLTAVRINGQTIS